jgi:NDP-sugar pyrophosphorylase family protein
MELSAVILAAGMGTRMGHLCEEIPKPMLEFNGFPFIQYQVSWLLRSGCSEVVIVIGHLGHKISEVFATSEWRDRGVKLGDCGTPQGTAQAVEIGLSRVTSPNVFLTNGDTVLEFKFTNTYEKFVSQDKPIMSLLTLRHGVQNQGAILVEKSVVTEFAEGGATRIPSQTGSTLRASSTGCYFMQSNFAKQNISASDISFERTTLPRLVESRYLAGISVGNSKFIDYGTLERHAQLQREVSLLTDIYGEPIS